MLPKAIVYVKSYNGQTKCAYFLVEIMRKMIRKMID